MGRGIVIALVASLALNVFAVGFIAGRVLVVDHHRPPIAHFDGGGPRGGPFALMRNADVLPPDSRRAFREAFRSELSGMRESHREMRRLRGELNTLFAAEEWDEAAVRAKLEEIDAVSERQRAAMSNAFVKALGALPADQRQALMKAAEERRGERRRRFRERMEDKRGGE